MGEIEEGKRFISQHHALFGTLFRQFMRFFQMAPYFHVCARVRLRVQGVA